MFGLRLRFIACGIVALFGLSFIGARPCPDIVSTGGEGMITSAQGTPASTAKATPSSSSTSSASKTSSGDKETIALLTLLFLSGADPAEVTRAVAANPDEAPMAP